jgi:hypothetical protein
LPPIEQLAGSKIKRIGVSIRRSLEHSSDLERSGVKPILESGTITFGQQAREFLDRIQEAGEHTVVWDGTDPSGRSVASRIYFYRVKAGNTVQTRKMMLLK